MNGMDAERRRLACTSCREAKHRCIAVDPFAADGICRRCSNQNLPCRYEKSRYGARIARRTATLHDPVFRPSTASLAPQIACTPQNLSGHTDVHVTNISGVPMSPPSSSDRVNIRTIEADVTRHLDPQLAGNPAISTARPSAYVARGVDVEADDPIRLQHLSSLEASNLFRQFMQHLNPIIALFDPNFHDFASLSKCSELFTAVLAVSAKFFRPQLHRHLLSHAQTLVNRAVSVGTCSLELVKSLLILVFWKDPQDTSAWVKIGIAIRLGYQLGLHQDKRENQAPEARDARRTWYCLSCADKSYSELFSLPVAIPLEYCGEIDTIPSRYVLSVDAHLACSMALTSPHLLWLKMKRDEASISLTSKRCILEDVYERFNRHLSAWFPGRDDFSALSLVEYHFLKWIDLIELLRLRFELLECFTEVEIPDRLQECLAMAEMCTDQTERVAETGILLYLQDTCATRLSSYGSILYKLFWRLRPMQQRAVVDMLKRVHRFCTEASRGDDSAATAFVSRFLHRCLRNLSQESRANSRRPSPAPDASSTLFDEGHDAIFDIQAFLQEEVPPAPDSELLDQQYWSTLFANPPFGMVNDQLSFDFGA